MRIRYLSAWDGLGLLALDPLLRAGVANQELLPHLRGADLRLRGDRDLVALRTQRDRVVRHRTMPPIAMCMPSLPCWGASPTFINTQWTASCIRIGTTLRSCTRGYRCHGTFGWK